MKVLLTADLHYRPGWFDWLEDEAHKYALISIAGDLLDMFSGVPLGDQLAQVKDFLQRLAEKVSVAVCSGNHDAVDVVPPLLPGIAASYVASWLGTDFHAARATPYFSARGNVWKLLFLTTLC